MRNASPACLVAVWIGGCGASRSSNGPVAATDAAFTSTPDSSLDATVGTDGGNSSGGGVNAGLPDATVDAMTPCADDMAWVEVPDGAPCCIDLYEGALAQREIDGGETAWPFYLPIDDVDASTLRAVPARGLYPQGYISEVQASAACAASGKRLCSFAEWTAACRGQPAHDNVYPYGDTYRSGYCNEGDESPIVELFGSDASYDDQELNDPRCDQLDGGLARGGSHTQCVSAYGALDMHGNIHEWIDETNADGTGSFMGGYFVDATLNGPGCEYRTSAHAKTYHDYSTGFRCCAEPH